MSSQSSPATIGIVGAGTMGTGIAQVAAQAGHKVFVIDRQANALVRSQAKIGSVMERLVQKGKLDQAQADALQQRIEFSENLSVLAPCGLVIEAVAEVLRVKQELLQTLDGIVERGAVIATNTSSLLVTAIASARAQSEKVVGLHFFNPAPLLPLVEVVRALQTSEATVREVTDLVVSWGKQPVQVQDTPGFIVNRVARPFYGEALVLVEEGFADPATIDWAMREVGGFRMGPFELMDLIGIDVNLQVTKQVFEATYFDPRYRPSVIQERLVAAGRFGRKSEQGFYDYREGASNLEPNEDRSLAEAIVDRIVGMLINEAVEAVRLKIASVEDIDKALTLGVNYPKGMLAWADEVGCADVLARLERLQSASGDGRYRPSPLLRSMVESKGRFYG